MPRMLGTYSYYDVRPMDNGGFVLTYHRSDHQYAFFGDDTKQEGTVEEFHKDMAQVHERIRVLDNMTIEEIRAQKRMPSQTKGDLASPQND